MRFLILAIVMMFAQSVFAFPDVEESHPCAKQINFLSETGVVVGYPDGTFHPDDNVTRAEFATMAIKAIKQNESKVNQPMDFNDVALDYWAYDAIKSALYFELVTADTDFFRPDDQVSRAEAISVAVNALADKKISSFNTDKKYTDAQAQQPATRAEVVSILYDMIEQVRTNPNAKIAQVMTKKTGEGYAINGATVDGNVGTIPAGTVLPVAMRTYIGTQFSKTGETYTATVPYNYVTKENYILIEKNASLKGELADVERGRWFIQNGTLVLNNTQVKTVNDQSSEFNAMGDVRKYRNWFMELVRTVFKGEKLEVPPGSVVYVRLRKPLRVDLSNGWILPE